MKELDNTIEKICKMIQGMIESECISEGCFFPDLVRALAELVSAKAELISCHAFEHQ